MRRRARERRDGGRRPRWPLVLLLGSVAATGLAAHHAYGTVRAQRRVVASVLTEYSRFAAWSYRQRLSDRLLAASAEIIGAVNHGANTHTSPHVPHASELGHYIPWDDACYCHRAQHAPLPAVLFGFELGSDTVGIGVNRYATEESWLVDPIERMVFPPATPIPAVPPPRASEYADRFGWLADTLNGAVRREPHPQGGYWWRIGEVGGVPRYVTYTLMPTSWGDTIVYGAEYDAGAFIEILESVFDDELLPPTFTGNLSNRDVLGLRVTTADERPLLMAGAAIAGGDDALARLSPELGGLGVRMRIPADAAERFIVGGLPRDRLPFLMSLLVLSAALGAVALTQVRREAELSRARSAFVSSISHELRTPLAQIRLQLETLRLGRARDDDVRERSLAQIDRETTRLGQLVDNVLLYSRGATQALAGPAQETDAGEAVARIVAEYAPLAAARRAAIDIDAAAAAGQTAALRLPALRHILVNLLDNAVKYGPAGQTVRVRAAVEAGMLRVIVRDEGPGVTKEERRHVFDPFRRGASTAARGSGGSGIGLTLVRDLVEAQSGRVWVGDGPGGVIGFELPITDRGTSS